MSSIERKQWYAHKKSSQHKLQVLNVSAMHDDHIHVGIMFNGKIFWHGHMHQKDISESWEKIFPAENPEG